MNKTVANYEPTRTKTGGNGKDLKMKGAIQRRIASNQPQRANESGYLPGGKTSMAPMNGKGAGTMVTPNRKGGVVSTFIKENFSKSFKK